MRTDVPAPHIDRQTLERVSEGLHREMRVRFAPVPEWPAATLYDHAGFALVPGGFHFITDGGVAFHYAVGEGITAALPRAEAGDEFKLFLWGTVFGAVAWLNGYFPLHASAVEIGGQAVAFTGDSGAGKSTLAAALAATGMPHVCDDTLPLVRAGGTVLAVPDRKPLKLWGDAFGLLGVSAEEPILSVPGKSYARPVHSVTSALPLAHLMVLEEAPAVSIEPSAPRDALSGFADAMYRAFIPSHLGDHEGHAQWMLALLKQVRVWRLRRPKLRDEPTAFKAQVDELAGLIAAHCR